MHTAKSISKLRFDAFNKEWQESFDIRKCDGAVDQMLADMLNSLEAENERIRNLGLDAVDREMDKEKRITELEGKLANAAQCLRDYKKANDIGVPVDPTSKWSDNAVKILSGSVEKHAPEDKANNLPHGPTATNAGPALPSQSNVLTDASDTEKHAHFPAVQVGRTQETRELPLEQFIPVHAFDPCDRVD